MRKLINGTRINTHRFHPFFFISTWVIIITCIMESYRGIVQTAADAVLLLEAARLHLVPRVKRRLKDSERGAIRAGDVFVWNEKEAKMRRWTDGRSWSASRVTGSFLTYKEMVTSHKANNNGNMAELSIPSYSYKNDGLIKQSYSITTKNGDKLHLISYSNLSFFINSKQKRPIEDPAFQHIKLSKDIYPLDDATIKLHEEEKNKTDQSTVFVKSPLQKSTAPPCSTPYVRYLPIKPSPSPASSSIPRSVQIKTKALSAQMDLPPISLKSMIPRRVTPLQHMNDLMALKALDKTFTC